MYTVQYIRWTSFSPKTRKISFINTLVDRAHMICSNTKLGSELDKIKQLLREQSLSLTGTGAEANLQGYEIFRRLFVGVQNLL